MDSRQTKMGNKSILTIISSQIAQYINGNGWGFSFNAYIYIFFVAEFQKAVEVSLLNFLNCRLNWKCVSNTQNDVRKSFIHVWRRIFSGCRRNAIKIGRILAPVSPLRFHEFCHYFAHMQIQTEHHILNTMNRA